MKCVDCLFYVNLRVTQVCLIGSDVKRKIFKEVYGEWRACERFMPKSLRREVSDEVYSQEREG